MPYICKHVCMYVYIYMYIYTYIQTRIRWKFLLKKKENYDTNVTSKLLKEAVVDIIILMRFFYIRKLKYGTAGPSGRAV